MTTHHQKMLSLACTAFQPDAVLDKNAEEVWSFLAGKTISLASSSPEAAEFRTYRNHLHTTLARFKQIAFSKAFGFEPYVLEDVLIFLIDLPQIRKIQMMTILRNF